MRVAKALQYMVTIQPLAAVDEQVRRFSRVRPEEAQEPIPRHSDAVRAEVVDLLDGRAAKTIQAASAQSIRTASQQRHTLSK
jgi:hypothetical protein